MSEHVEKMRRIVADIWDPSSKVKSEDVDLLLHHLRNSFEDEHSLLEAIKANESSLDARLKDLAHRKDSLIDHNLDPD
jgi:hypothetical protein